MKSYWLDNLGKLIEVGFAEHSEFAREMLIEEMGRFEMHDYLNERNIYPYEELHNRGWIRIKIKNNSVQVLGNCIDLTKKMNNTIDPKMNSKQLSIAKNICKKYGYEFSKAINDKRFH